MTARGRFITVEGGEGAGKSTLIAALRQVLEARGLQVLTTREPGGTALAEQVRTLVLDAPEDDAWSPLAETLLMNAARVDHVEKKIAPALAAGTWVICDRFADSTLVYQGIGGIAETVLLAIQAEVTKEARPDLTLILDGPVEALLGRREARGTSDSFERRPVKFHEKVRAGFLEIAQREPARCAVLDATRAPDEVLAEAVSTVKTRLELT